MSVYYVYDVDVVILLVIVCYAFLFGALRSSNQYSLLGSYRAVVMIVSYDVVLLIVLLLDTSFIVVLLSGFVFFNGGWTHSQ